MTALLPFNWVDLWSLVSGFLCLRGLYFICIYYIGARLVAVAWIRRSFLFGEEGNWTCGDFWLVGRVGSMKNYGRMILLPLVLECFEIGMGPWWRLTKWCHGGVILLTYFNFLFYFEMIIISNSMDICFYLFEWGWIRRNFFFYEMKVKIDKNILFVQKIELDRALLWVILFLK
jgi:hypothetical protein